MIGLLEKSILSNRQHSFYDIESKSMLELISNFHGKINEVVEEVNGFQNRMNQKMGEFCTSSDKDREVWEKAMRQEFQEFINIIDLKVLHMDSELKKMEDFIHTDVREVINTIIQEKIATGELVIQPSYNPSNESLDFVVGEVI